MTAPAGARRIAVDWTRCDGHGLCAVLAPDLITPDPWGFPLFRPGVTADPATTRRLVAICPALALRDEGVPA